MYALVSRKKRQVLSRPRQYSRKNSGKGLSQLTHQPDVHNILHTTGVQAKLQVGRADDPYEKEADRIADHVMRMPEPVKQRKAA